MNYEKRANGNSGGQSLWCYDGSKTLTRSCTSCESPSNLYKRGEDHPSMKAILLLSGGIDSPVAGWLMKRHGVDIVALHCSNEPFTNGDAEQKSRKAAELLGIPMRVVKIGTILGELLNKCDRRYYYILQKRFLLRCAQELARKLGAQAIITGDNLGQVGSQTLSNLAVIQQATTLPVWRPLLCYDKRETMDLAKKIGSYELSIGPEICATLGPKHPATASTTERIEGEENKLDVVQLVHDAVASLT